MIILSSNPVSVLPGTESSGFVQPGMPAETGNPQSFTASMLQQLGLLQSSLPNNAALGTGLLSDLQLKEPTVDSSGAGQSMQDFAALLGKSSPTANNSTAGINLDDTLNTLSDVLQYLQSLQTDTASSELTPLQNSDTGKAVVTTAVAANNSATNALAQLEQPIDPAALAAAAEVLNQQIQQVQQKGDTTYVTTNLSPATASLSQLQSIKPSQSGKQSKPELDPNALAAAISAAMQQVQQPIVQQQRPAQDGSVNEHASNTPIIMAMTGDNDLAIPNTSSQLSNTDNKLVGASAQSNQDQNTSNSKNETGVAQFNLAGASQNTGQDNTANYSDKDADDLNTLIAPASYQESEKSPTRMSADIAQLNQAVSTGKAVDLPPMTRNLSHPDWNQELSDKLVWMHKQDVPSAELRLNPEHLGPITIKIDVSQDQATVSFTAHHAEVKDAIEAAIPKLREMLGNQQLTLVDVNVSQQQSEQNKSPYQTGGQAGNGNKSGQNGNTENSSASTTIDTVDEIDSGRAIVSNGLLSLFA